MSVIPVVVGCIERLCEKYLGGGLFPRTRERALLASSGLSYELYSVSDRGEVLPLPEALEDHPAPANPVRLIDAFVRAAGFGTIKAQFGYD